jgi:hypothetical protein
VIVYSVVLIFGLILARLMLKKQAAGGVGLLEGAFLYRAQDLLPKTHFQGCKVSGLSRPKVFMNG